MKHDFNFCLVVFYGREPPYLTATLLSDGARVNEQIHYELYTNKDILATLLYTSDPYITNLRKSYIKKSMELRDETYELLGEFTSILNFSIHYII